MKRRIVLLVVAMIAVGLFVPTVCSAAAPVQTRAFAGRSADGGYWSEGENGAYESLSIWAGVEHNVDTVAGTENNHDRVSFGIVGYEVYTPADGDQPETFKSAQVKEPMSFSCEHDLSAAGLVAPEATADVAIWYDEMPWEGEGEEVPPDAAETVPISLTAAWSGYGPSWRERSFSHESIDGCFWIDRTSLIRRAATADVRNRGRRGPCLVRWVAAGGWVVRQQGHWCHEGVTRVARETPEGLPLSSGLSDWRSTGQRLVSSDGGPTAQQEEAGHVASSLSVSYRHGSRWTLAISREFFSGVSAGLLGLPRKPMR